jgi:hypothetical protein
VIPILGLTAAGGYVMWRLLVALFGDRPANLIPLAVFLLCPLSLRAAFWLTAAWTIIPLQFFIPAVLLAVLWYVRAPDRRRLALAGVAYAGALLSWEKALLILPLTAMFVLLYLGEGTGRARLSAVTRGTWRLWAVLGGLTAPYLAWYLTVSHWSTGQHLSASGAWRLVQVALGTTLAPMYLGGPWGVAPPPGGKAAVLVLPLGVRFLTWVGLALLIAVSIVLCRQAWRAWAMLGAYVALCIALVVAGRLGILGAAIGLDTRYLADSVPVLALALALAFSAPIDRRGDPGWDRRQLVVNVAGRDAVPLRARSERALRWGALAVVAAYAISAMVTGTKVANQAATYSVRPWFATVRTAIARHPAASVYDGWLPAAALPAILDPGATRLSRALGPIARDVRWDAPSGAMLAFDPDGHLVPAVVRPVTAAEPGPVPSCGYLVSRAPVTIAFPRRLGPLTWGVLLRYFTDERATGWVAVGAVRQDVKFDAGVHALTLVTRGPLAAVRVWGGGARVCVARVQAGTMAARPPAPPGAGSSG